MKFLRHFQQEGLSLRVEALKLIKKVLAEQEDQQTRKELIQIIIEDLKRNTSSDTTLCIITEDDLQGSLQRILEEQTKTEEEESIQVENAFQFPLLQFNSSRNTYERIPPTNMPLHAPANKKIHLMRERLTSIRTRLQRDPMFQNKQSFSKAAVEAIKVTSVEELIGSQGVQSVLGFLSRIDDEFLYLEDLSGYVKFTFSRGEETDKEDSTGNTIVMPAIYSEGMVVLAQGEMKGGVFHATLLCHPKAESRDAFLGFFPSFSATPAAPLPPSSNVVILSDVWLDIPKVRSKLRTLFEGYCSNRFLPELFVLTGNFHSIPLDSLATNMISYKNGFEHLAQIIQSFPLLMENSRIVLVPGPTDPFDSGLLPREPIASQFIKPLQKLSNVEFGSNPCRIQFHSKEIVVFRQDMLSKIQRLSAVSDTYPSEDLYDMYAQSILCQGHLSPVPLRVNPVYWNFDYTLRLDVLPDMLVLADSCEQFNVDYEGCHVLNPSSFAQEFSFASYVPADDEISFSIIGDTYEEVEMDDPLERVEEEDTESDEEDSEIANAETTVKTSYSTIVEAFSKNRAPTNEQESKEEIKEEIEKEEVNKEKAEKEGDSATIVEDPMED